tara:strand:- start:1559 stop:2452 length:894 start_codon:yes stop_codon:yes gene_type:complete
MNNIDVSPSGSFNSLYDSLNTEITSRSNPIVLALLSFIVIFYFLVFNQIDSRQISIPSVSSVNVANSSNNPGINMIEIIMWGLFIFLILINGVQYFFSIDVKTSIKNIFKSEPEVDIKINNEIHDENHVLDMHDGNLDDEIANEDEVFHISDNKYTFDEATALCKAYNSDLASYPQVEEAYRKGGEWCSYGWSKDQMALFPTQMSTWEKLQKIKDHENDCGRPGVNGGYIDNANVKFGVNCYGKKPNMTSEEKKLMESSSIYPLTKREKKLNMLVDKYKKKISDVLVSPFNNIKWNE